MANDETGEALRRSLDAIDRLRARVFILGWGVVAGTLALYARLYYLHKTSNDIEQLLSASVTALTALVAWAAFAIILIVTRSTKSILRAIELSTRRVT